MQRACPLSVVIPIYNGSRYLSEALDSVKCQTHLPDEVILVDDCSSDASVEIAEDWAARHALSLPIRFFSTERNSGSPAQPLNIGIAAASGEFIAVLEQDDIFASKKLERCHEMLLKYPQLQYVAHGASRFGLPNRWGSVAQRNFERDSLVRGMTKGRSTAAFLMENSLGTLLAVKHSMFPTGFPGMVFRKSAWQDSGGLPECFRVATDFSLLLTLAGSGTGCFLSDRLYSRRAHANCLSHNSSRSFLEVLQILEMQLRSHPGMFEIQGMPEALSWRIVESAWNIGAFGYRRQAGSMIDIAVAIGGGSLKRAIQKRATLLMPLYRMLFMPYAVSNVETANRMVDLAEGLLMLVSRLRGQTSQLGTK